MKWIKRLGIAFAALLVLCCGIGLLLPSEWTVNTSVEIDASLAEVYPHISTPRLFTAHTESYAVKTDRGGLTTFELGDVEQGAGAWWTATSEGSNVHIEITKAEPAEGMWYEGKIQSEVVNSHGSILMEDLGDGRTRVTWDDKGTLDMPVVGGLVGVGINYVLEEFFHGTLVEIKTAVEGGDDDGG